MEKFVASLHLPLEEFLSCMVMIEMPKRSSKKRNWFNLMFCVIAPFGI